MNERESFLLRHSVLLPQCVKKTTTTFYGETVTTTEINIAAKPEEIKNQGLPCWIYAAQSKIEK